MVNDDQPQADWRVKVGFTIFAASIGWPVFIPILPLMGASATTTAAISGVMLVAAEVMLISAAAIAGKDGFAFIRSKVFGFVKAYGPPGEVSRTRYRIGMVMFATPLAFAWAAPYFGHHLPGFEHAQLVYAIAGDALLLISLFVLGGGFWDKLRALFHHDAYAVIPDMSPTRNKSE